MRLIFMGTPEFAVVTLKALIEAGHDIACVYAQPPRAKGRGLALTPTPVHAFAQSQNIDVRTPLHLKSEEEHLRFGSLKADAAVIVAYGLLLPQAILDLPLHGCFNIHASLLPRWRGAAPIQRAIMAGDPETGVTIMRMELGLDTGPMIKTERVPITHSTTGSTLHDELAILGAELMVDVLRNPLVKATPQPSAGISYAKKIDKAETRIDFSRSAVDVRNHIHGLSLYPGAWCMMNGARVKILEAAVGHGPIDFKCADDFITFTKLQREGKSVMDAATFLRGFSNPEIS